MAWEEFAVSGVTESTPTNILLGAGTLYRNFVFDAEAKKWNGAITFSRFCGITWQD